MIAAAPREADRPVVCSSCDADRMGCELKSHYSGRPCCDACKHRPDGGDGTTTQTGASTSGQTEDT